jgi:high-affinity iron transporter
VPLIAHAATQTPGSTPGDGAESVRANLSRAQIALSSDAAAAQNALSRAEDAYGAILAHPLGQIAPEVNARMQAGLKAADESVREGDVASFAAARAQVWTSLLQGSYALVEDAIVKGDLATAQAWLPVREFRRATRFSRPNADATLAVSELERGAIKNEEALEAVRADLLDTYQARLNEMLSEVLRTHERNFAARRVESAALAEGYFHILAPAYRDQRGEAALQSAQSQFARLRDAAQTGQGVSEAVAAVQETLKGFRAAPLSAAEQARRAGQMQRFISLVPVEYGRGIRDGRVAIDLEIREAITFRNGAEAAFNDLRSLLDARDPIATQQVAQLFAQLEKQLNDASTHTVVASPDTVRARVDQLAAVLKDIMPQEWQKQDSAADFDVIQTALDQMEAAVAAGEYELAESARLEAYAILESGPEAKLTAFAPQHVLPIEELFWYGQSNEPGLAYLIEQRAPVKQIKASRDALDAELAAAQKALAGNNAPAAVATNASIIVFREGLEAVLILASLMASFKVASQRQFRKPMWLGTILALIATVATWLLMRGALTMFARYGEKLEAVVSLVAIAVLLLITNWFFHDIYWTGWMANFHKHKKTIIAGAASQFIGLMILGFTSIYREGFETALFLQALVLEAGTATVMIGVAIGLLATVGVGLIVFVLQARLPMKKMLVVTGVMIGAVLLVMVGNTVHALQVVGWLPTTPIRGLTLPYWFGLWLGTYATWQGILLQIAAAVFVIGSYFLAEWKHKRGAPSKVARPAAA